jgi:hypothetical protein
MSGLASVRFLHSLYLGHWPARNDLRAGAGENDRLGLRITYCITGVYSFVPRGAPVSPAAASFEERTILGHSGARRRREPGIHNLRSRNWTPARGTSGLVVMDSGPAGFARVPE